MAVIAFRKSISGDDVGRQDSDGSDRRLEENYEAMEREKG